MKTTTLFTSLLAVAFCAACGGSTKQPADTEAPAPQKECFSLEDESGTISVDITINADNSVTGKMWQQQPNYYSDFCLKGTLQGTKNAIGELYISNI